MNAAYETLFTLALCILGVLLFLCLLRAIRGPRIADRVVGINMIGTIIDKRLFVMEPDSISTRSFRIMIPLLHISGFALYHIVPIYLGNG